MDIETIEIKELMNDPANVRKHDERNLDSIKASLLRFGQQKPIVVDGKGIVVAGNGTLMGAKSLGWKEIQIVRTELEGADAVAYAIADNRTAELAVWDEDALAQTLASLQIDESIDEAVTGFTEQEIEELIGKTVGIDDIEEDEVPEVPEEAITQVGDLWLLGGHRLLCGDSTSEDDVARLMDGEQIESVVTDPPYGMDAVKNSGVLKGKYRDVAGDDSINVAVKSFNLINKEVPQIWWGANYYANELPNQSCWLVWDKNNGGSDQMDCELAWTNLKGVTRQFTQASEKTNRVHPTQKPIQLLCWCIGKMDSKTVLDLFLGSGATLIACEKLNRKCYGVEIDPLYCDVIVKRWENLTGDTAQRVAVDSVK